ncbi:class I SAM-dependent methyltransferase [soil metagenome]
MNPEEYQKLERLDRDHWFYRGKRAIVRHWIERYADLQADDLLIDAGMGTGTWLVEMSPSCKVLGLDDHDESLEVARPRLEAVGGNWLKTTLDQIDLPDGCATVVTAMDVLEHLDDDRSALREMIRLTRPGGLIVITVPALRWLWSDWDVVLHHRRRYHRADLRKLVDEPGVELLRCAYFNSAALPPIGLVRLWRKLRPPKPGAPRSEDAIPARPLNGLLYHSMVAPACWPWFRPPMGVSLLAVLKRTAESTDRVEPGSSALERVGA